MRLPTHSLPLPLLYLLIALALPLISTVSAQANRTIDDFAPSGITYTPASAVTHGNLTGLDITKLYNGTVSMMNGSMNADGSGTVNMTVRFTGTAFWIFTVKPLMDTSYGNSFNVYVDGVPAVQSASFDQVLDAEYNQVAYNDAGLKSGPHEVLFSVTESSVVWLDYFVFTSNSAVAQATIPPVQSSVPATSSSTSTKSSETGTTATPSKPSSSSKGSASDTTHIHIAIPIAAAVVGLLVIGAGCSIWYICHKKRQRRGSNGNPGGGEWPYGRPKPEADINVYGPPVVLPQTGNAYSPPYSHSQSGGYPQAQLANTYPQSSVYPQQQSPYREDPGAQESQAALLRMPSTQSVDVSGLSSPMSGSSGSYRDPGSATSPIAYLPSQASAYFPPTPISPSTYTYEANGRATLSYSPVAGPSSSSREPESSAQPYVLAQQRAIEAEYTPPRQWIIDEKKQPERGAESPMAFAANPDNGPRAHAAVPPADPALSTIAAEMQALRAQVARLEGERSAHSGNTDGDVHGVPDVPPPAYD
ncbi:unnamed protein product [Mycena citricolor]|uniref:Uncharacterized protein n=1 Tax=Mycena citricolor TaxID=2018698 RepID=A0AAD2HV43_9AGAR|nr:unnamed protein product [Mycena citricolor]